MTSPTPFHIQVSDSELLRLHQKLALTTLPDEIDEAGWAYGVPLTDVQELLTYWRNEFDWKKQETLLNERLQQYTLDVPVEDFGTLNVHFVHQKSKVKGAIPLLFVHGWPGSFLEVSKLFPILIAKSDKYPSFHVVAPSLPNFGFSEGVKKKGFGMHQYAEVCHKVMLALGYDQYVTQGGDWGFRITRMIGTLYGGKHCVGSHTNMPMGFKPRFFTNPFLWFHNLLFPYSAVEKAGFIRGGEFEHFGIGYRVIQNTKPQTLGYGLADSPIGLLAWIYEKMKDWTDGYPWTKDEILTWVNIYLFSRAGPAASLRIYYEAFSQNQRDLALYPMSKVPLGLAFFPKEIYHPPRNYARTLGGVVYEKEHEHGGHFAAYEQPEAIAGDLRNMFGKNGNAFGVVNGQCGYDA
ncbi:hypothetical protein M422DRAFT_42077 [Sphaerobolus stellatus SS14]|nr:hypothetical protein M422DRAFT_42077 [Sphaerobolus stellatus SS14]